MARAAVCDICGRRIDEDNPIAAKLFATLLRPGQTSREWRNKYNAHMDIGKCCFTKVNQLGSWQRRKPKKKALNSMPKEEALDDVASQRLPSPSVPKSLHSGSKNGKSRSSTKTKSPAKGT